MADDNTMSEPAAQALRRADDPYGEYARDYMDPYTQAGTKLVKGALELPEKAFRAANPQFVSDDPREQQRIMGDAALGVGMLGTGRMPIKSGLPDFSAQAIVPRGSNVIPFRPRQETQPPIWDTPPENVPPKSGFESERILDKAMGEGNRPRLAIAADRPQANPGRIEPAAIERALNAPRSPTSTLDEQLLYAFKKGRAKEGGGEGEGGGPGGVAGAVGGALLSPSDQQKGQIGLPENDTDVALSARMRSEPLQQELEGIAHPTDEPPTGPLPQPYLDKIKKMEGFDPVPRWDVKQWTVGWGTRAKGPDERPTLAELEKRFTDEITQAAQWVQKLNPNLPENLKAALTSLTFNVGPGWMRHGLGKIVQTGSPQQIVQAMQAYANVSGHHNAAIAQRRREEASWVGRPPADIPARTAHHQRAPKRHAAPPTQRPQHIGFRPYEAL